MGQEWSNLEQIIGTDTSGQERLMGVTKSSVSQQGALVFADGLGKSFWSL